MFFLAGSAASSALDLISALQQSLAGQNSSTPPATDPGFDLGAGGSPAAGGSSTTATSPLAPSTMGALLMAQGNGQAPLVNGDAFSAQLFSMLDRNGDGGISQSEFDTIFGKNGDTTKADALFARLDANHDGNVNPDELTNALSGEVDHAHLDHRFPAGANPLMGNGNPADPFGVASSETVTNTDGSTTMTITYKDGSQVAMTRPAATIAGPSPTAWAHNVIERLIQRQMQMMAASPAGQGFALSA